MTSTHPGGGGGSTAAASARAAASASTAAARADLGWPRRRLVVRRVSSRVVAHALHPEAASRRANSPSSTMRPNAHRFVAAGRVAMRRLSIRRVAIGDVNRSFGGYADHPLLDPARAFARTSSPNRWAGDRAPRSPETYRSTSRPPRRVQQLRRRADVAATPCRATPTGSRRRRRPCALACRCGSWWNENLPERVRVFAFGISRSCWIASPRVSERPERHYAGSAMSAPTARSPAARTKTSSPFRSPAPSPRAHPEYVRSTCRGILSATARRFAWSSDRRPPTRSPSGSATPRTRTPTPRTRDPELAIGNIRNSSLSAGPPPRRARREYTPARVLVLALTLGVQKPARRARDVSESSSARDREELLRLLRLLKRVSPRPGPGRVPPVRPSFRFVHRRRGGRRRSRKPFASVRVRVFLARFRSAETQAFASQLLENVAPRSPRPPPSRLVGAWRTPRLVGGRSADRRDASAGTDAAAGGAAGRARSPREARWTSSTARVPRERSFGSADGPRVRPAAPSRAWNVAQCAYAATRASFQERATKKVRRFLVQGLMTLLAPVRRPLHCVDARRDDSLGASTASAASDT